MSIRAGVFQDRFVKALRLRQINTLGFVLKLTRPGWPRWNQVFALLGVTEMRE